MLLKVYLYVTSYKTGLYFYLRKTSTTVHVNLFMFYKIKNDLAHYTQFILFPGFGNDNRGGRKPPSDMLLEL